MFMRGWKRAVVLSGTASTGFNLHASLDVENKQRRHHITMEVGWAPEMLLQQLGMSSKQIILQLSYMITETNVDICMYYNYYYYY